MREVEMHFLDHLEELRWRIIKALVSVFILTIICFAFSDQILKLLLIPTENLTYKVNLQVLKVQTIFVIKLELALIAGIIISLPVIFYQIWAFIAPGLLDRERKYIIPVITFATLSFLAGSAFAYYIIVPYSLEFFLSLAPPSITNNIAIDFYFGYVIRIILVFGVVFELPVVSLLLTKIGLITPSMLRKYRSYAIVIIFIAAAILTPPDPTTQILLAVPLVILYEITIIVSHFFVRKDKKSAS
ncbi:MAG: twin-arginine translocase subunit TatC [Calditrichaceae bacterium]